MRFIGRGMYKAGFACDNSPCAVLSSLFGKPTKLGTMGGTVQLDSYALGSGMY